MKNLYLYLVDSKIVWIGLKDKSKYDKMKNAIYIWDLKTHKKELAGWKKALQEYYDKQR